MARHGAHYLRVGIRRAQGNSSVAIAESSGGGGVLFGDGTRKKMADSGAGLSVGKSYGLACWAGGSGRWASSAAGPTRGEQGPREAEERRKPDEKKLQAKSKAFSIFFKFDFPNTFSNGF